VGGELASAAERRAAEAQAGQREIERLYQELQIAFDRASEAEAARRNEALKAALLDALTHNLRTPLTAIKAAVTALIRPGLRAPASDLPSEGRQELLEVIDEESDRLNRFIEALSRPDSAEPAQPLHLRAVDVNEIIQAGVQRADILTRDHHIVLAIDDALPTLSVDAASMAEVIYTLIDNASKYAPPHTAITVTATNDDAHHVRITVADEGPGIPAELRERVFEKFFRVPGREPHDSRRGGIGLGLPIARRLVQAQAGQIWIESPRASGVGSAVILTLPITEDSIQPDRVAAPQAVAVAAK
jgi:K+-sensing histidine kinase KdpD